MRRRHRAAHRRIWLLLAALLPALLLGTLALRQNGPTEARAAAAARAMSARLVPVGWTPAKLVIDAVAAAAVAAYLLAYVRLAPLLQSLSLPPDDQTVLMRAYGTCAFLLLTFVLAIGPLARLDRRFLPLLYNRRHLGVLTCVIAAAHVLAVLDWYFAYSAVPPPEAMLAADPGFFGLHGIPFIPFGLFAFLILLALAATSHDFWLAFLTPPVWKAMHMGVYGAYAAAVLHVALGALRATADPTLAVVLAAGLGSVIVLHLAAAAQERRRDAALAPPGANPLDRRRPRRRRAGRRRHRGASARRRAGGDLPPSGPPVGGQQPLRPPERPAGRGQGGRRLHHLPLARVPVPAGGWLRAATLHRETRHLPPAPAWRDARTRPAAEPARHARAAAAGRSAPAPPARRISSSAGPPRRRAPLRGSAGGPGRWACRWASPLLGLVLGRAADDPGAGAFDWDAGEQTLVGTATARPYPLLHLPSGHTLMLAGLGKSGADLDPALDGRRSRAAA